MDCKIKVKLQVNKIQVKFLRIFNAFFGYGGEKTSQVKPSEIQI